MESNDYFSQTTHKVSAIGAHERISHILLGIWLYNYPSNRLNFNGDFQGFNIRNTASHWKSFTTPHLWHCFLFSNDVELVVCMYVITTLEDKCFVCTWATIPLKVCRGTRILLCSQGFWCTGVKIGPGASFANTISIIQKLRRHHVA